MMIRVSHYFLDIAGTLEIIGKADDEDPCLVLFQHLLVINNETIRHCRGVANLVLKAVKERSVIEIGEPR